MQRIFMNWRVTVAGLLSWLVPFLASFPFFSPDQGLLVPLPLFKSLMVVIGSGVGLALFVWIFRRIPIIRGAGLAIGLYWLLINWVLDIAILVPMSGSDIGTWFTDIGLRYLVIPMMGVALCLVATRTKT
jgi:hypothetical protein